MKIPVIFYHAIHKNDSADIEKYSVSIDQFTEQVDYLLKAGHKGILLDEFFEDGSDSGGKRIAITFDDGAFSDFSIATPILAERRLPATFFITVNYIGTRGYLGWDDIRQMSRMGMSIQSHSLNHVFLSDLDDRALARELGESKRLLENRTGKPVHYISLPGGFCSRRVLDAARRCGYRAVCTSVPGYNEAGAGMNDFLVLNRMLITRKTSLEAFSASVEGNFSQALSTRALYTLKLCARKTLGSRAYYALWSRFFKEVK